MEVRALAVGGRPQHRTILRVVNAGDATSVQGVVPSSFHSNHGSIVMPTTAPFEHTIRHLTLAAALPVLLTACGSGSDAVGEWHGTVDTLPSGEIVVRNTDDPLWAPEEAWRVVEDLRIGEAMSEGPDLFGANYSFDVDALGRIFVLDNQAQEVRIFDSGGAFVRTVGRGGARDRGSSPRPVRSTSPGTERSG